MQNALSVKQECCASKVDDCELWRRTYQEWPVYPYRRSVLENPCFSLLGILLIISTEVKINEKCQIEYWGLPSF